MATVEPKAKRSPLSPECSVSVDDIRQFLLDLGSSFSSLDCRVLEIVNSSSTWIEIYCSKSVLLTCNGSTSTSKSIGSSCRVPRAIFIKSCKSISMPILAIPESRTLPIQAFQTTSREALFK